MGGPTRQLSERRENTSISKATSAKPRDDAAGHGTVCATHLAPDSPDNAPPLLRTKVGSSAGIALSSPNPLPRRLRRIADLSLDGPNRGPLQGVGAAVLGDHADRARTHCGGVVGAFRHDPISRRLELLGGRLPSRPKSLASLSLSLSILNARRSLKQTDALQRPPARRDSCSEVVCS